MPCHHCREARSAAREAVKAALDRNAERAVAKAREAAKAIADKIKGRDADTPTSQ